MKYFPMGNPRVEQLLFKLHWFWTIRELATSRILGAERGGNKIIVEQIFERKVNLENGMKLLFDMNFSLNI